jgi:16S rRNA (cytidine1402-2'-O)-methyltransferase
MTKRYEETKRGNLLELNVWASEREILGEITLVIAGAQLGAQESTTDAMVARVREFEGAGMDRKSAIAAVAEEFSIAKRIVYAAVVDANKMST